MGNWFRKPKPVVEETEPLVVGEMTVTLQIGETETHFKTALHAQVVVKGDGIDDAEFWVDNPTLAANVCCNLLELAKLIAETELGAK